MAKKVEEKKMSNKKNEDKKINSILKNIKDFFNRPAPLIIFLILLVSFLVLYIYKTNSSNKIYVGEINNDEIQVANVHYFTNGDINYFYATPAIYLAKDTKIFNYQIGYYVVDENNNYYELATRSNSLENASSLKEIVNELSAWDFAESPKSEYFFDKDVLKYLDNLHFVIKASTKQDSTEADVVVDYEVDLTKITK